LSFIVAEGLTLTVSHFIFSLVLSLGEIIYGKLNKYQFVHFSILFVSIKKENGKVKIKPRKFKIGSNSGIIRSDRATNKNRNIVEIMTLVTPIIGTIIYGIIILKNSLLDIFILRWMLINFAVFSIITCWGLIRALKLAFTNKPEAIFVREVNDKLYLLKKGTTPRNLNFGFTEIPTKSSMDMYIKRYELFKFYHQIDKGEANDIATTIQNIERYLPEQFMQNNTPYYYELIFYYSAIDKNIEKVRRVYDIVSHVLIKDEDVNGRRVYAYYKYFIENNEKESREIASEGLKQVNKFDIKGLAFYEEKLLNELIRCIDNYKDKIEVECIY